MGLVKDGEASPSNYEQVIHALEQRLGQYDKENALLKKEVEYVTSRNVESWGWELTLKGLKTVLLAVVLATATCGVTDTVSNTISATSNPARMAAVVADASISMLQSCGRVGPSMDTDANKLASFAMCLSLQHHFITTFEKQGQVQQEEVENGTVESGQSGL